MKTLVSVGIFLFALSFCNLGDKLKDLSGSVGSNSNATGGPGNGTSTDKQDGSAEKTDLTAAQQTIQDSAVEEKWEDQGISFKLPKSWTKMDEKKESFNYKSPDFAFLLSTISIMPDDFPPETSLTVTYTSTLQQLKNGKYEKVRYLEIDGIKGVEWVEAMPEEKDSPRRQQWIGFRNYQGQNQQLNIMLSTKGSNFDKHRDDFPAILYSMKIDK